MAIPRLLLWICAAAALLAAACAIDDLVITRADRKIDLQSNVVRFILSLKLENSGSGPVYRVLFAFTTAQQRSLAFTSVVLVSGKAKSRSFTQLQVAPLEPGDESAPATSAGLGFLAASLPEPLVPGSSVLVEAYFSFMPSGDGDILKPFPAEISQAESQLLLFPDSSLVTTPYPVKTQVTTVKLPSSRVERFEAAEPNRKADSELRLGPYEDAAPQASKPLLVHFENNSPLVVAASLSRELEVSHWGNVYVTEDYDIVHTGAKLKGVFSRLELQMRPHSSGLPAMKGLVALLPRRARSVYFRDEIGNISTSNLRHEPRRSVLELSTRYPLFGGWRSTFTVGYSVPLSDLVHVEEDGTRVLNATFGTPFQDLPIGRLIVKVVLPEGSRAIRVSTPVPLTEQLQETKYSYLDTVGRPVAVLVKDSVVQELSASYFQVRYQFAPLFLLAEPLLLVGAFAAFFLICAVYVRMDLTLAKSSALYQAKLQVDQLMDAVQRLQSAVRQRIRVVDSLEASLLQLGRTGSVGPARAARRAAEEKLKELGAVLKSALATIEGQPRAPRSLALAVQIAAKDKEFVEKALRKQLVAVESYEKRLAPREIEAAVAPFVERLSALKGELKTLVNALDE